MVVEEGDLSSPEPQLSPTGGDVGGSGYQRGASQQQQEAAHVSLEPPRSESNRTSSGENENKRLQVQESVKQRPDRSDSVYVEYHESGQPTTNASIQASDLNELKDKSLMAAELEFG